MVWILISIVVIAIWIFLIVVSSKLRGVNSGAIFLAESKAAIENGSSMEEAIFSGLKHISRRGILSKLTYDEKIYFVQSFARINDLNATCSVLVSVIKKNDISLLKEPNKVDRMVQFCLSKSENKNG